MDEKNNGFIVTSIPHITSGTNVSKIMLFVLVSLAPAGAASVYRFGIKALAIIFVSVASCVAFEALYRMIVKKPATVTDFSAAVTGLLLAYTLPVSSPLWMPAVGAFIAIIIVKQIFGGLGQNIVNPALAARVFLQAAYPSQMSDWSASAASFNVPAVSSATPHAVSSATGIHAVSSATPLAVMKLNAVTPAASDYFDALLGNINGSLGETCALALLAGGVFLIAVKVISWRIPFSFIFSSLLFFGIFGRNGLFTGSPFYEILLGGLVLGAFFMATDYTTSPVTPKGQLIMGCGCGLLAVVIRVYGDYPEGVNYAILIMNAAVPLIDRYTKPRVFGRTKRGKKNA